MSFKETANEGARQVTTNVATEQLVQAAFKIATLNSNLEVSIPLQKFLNKPGLEDTRISKRAFRVSEDIAKLNSPFIDAIDPEEKGRFRWSLAALTQKVLRSEASLKGWETRRARAAGVEIQHDVSMSLEQVIARQIAESEKVKEEKVADYLNNNIDRGRGRWNTGKKIARVAAVASFALVLASGLLTPPIDSKTSMVYAENQPTASASASSSVQTEEIKAEAAASAKAGVDINGQKSDTKTTTIGPDGTISERRVRVDGDRVRVEERSKTENADGKAESRAESEAKGTGADSEAKVKSEAKAEGQGAKAEAKKEAKAEGEEASAEVKAGVLINADVVRASIQGEASAKGGDSKVEIKGEAKVEDGNIKKEVKGEEKKEGGDVKVIEDEKVEIIRRTPTPPAPFIQPQPQPEQPTPVVTQAPVVPTPTRPAVIQPTPTPTPTAFTPVPTEGPGRQQPGGQPEKPEGLPVVNPKPTVEEGKPVITPPEAVPTRIPDAPVVREPEKAPIVLPITLPKAGERDLFPIKGLAVIGAGFTLAGLGLRRILNRSSF